MTATETKSAPYWGTRYQIRRQPYGKSGGWTWHIVDTAGDHEHLVSLGGQRGHAQAEADKLNADPSANYNGDSWPKVHYANIYDPEDACDCRDSRAPYPKHEGWRAPNVCGGVVGTFCKTHGEHDTCLRSVRGVNLTTDPLFLANRENELARRREDVARAEMALVHEEDRLDRLARLARRYAV